MADVNAPLSTVPQLRDFLRDRGVPVSGLNKKELSELAKSAQDSGIEPVRDNYCHEKELERRRYIG